jgi:hypothetical protein
VNENEPEVTILGCGHLSVNEDENTGECMHEDCVDARAERQYLDVDYDTPSQREQMESLADEKGRIG